MRATGSVLALAAVVAAVVAAAPGATATGHGPPATLLPVVGRIMTVECIGLVGAQSVYYELKVPSATRGSFDELFRAHMNRNSVPTSSDRVRDNFEAVLRELAIPGRVELLVLREEPGGGERVHEICEEQRAAKGDLAASNPGHGAPGLKLGSIRSGSPRHRHGRVPRQAGAQL